jgi:hypothetical protein
MLKVFTGRRGRKLVRVHVQNGSSLEGVYRGRRGGHYVLELAKLLESAGKTVALEGWVEIPERNVVFLQVLAEGAD